MTEFCPCGHLKDMHTIDGCQDVDATPDGVSECDCHKFYGGELGLEELFAGTREQQRKAEKAINNLFTSMGKPVPFPSGSVR